MTQYQMIIPRDSAYTTVNLLGHQKALHLTDSSDPTNRSFTPSVKRCDECLQKIEAMVVALGKEKMEFEEYDEKQLQFV